MYMTTQKTKRRHTTTQKYVIDGEINDECIWQHKKPNEDIQQHKNMLSKGRWMMNVCDDTQKTKRRNTTTQKYVINGQMNNKCMWRYIKNQTNTSNKPKIYH